MKAAARLALYRSTLETELRHFAHLLFLLLLDPVVARALVNDDAGNLDYRLARFAQSAGLDAIYLMDRDGLTISASNGELGEFYAMAVRAPETDTTGVVAIKTPQTLRLIEVWCVQQCPASLVVIV